MYEHNLNPVALNFYSFKIYWYSLAYIIGFLFTFWYSKHLIKKKILDLNLKITEDFITYGIIILILGGRIGYIFFYNLEYYFNNPVNILKYGKEECHFMGH